MSKYLFLALLMLHGLIHLLGFFKAFNQGKISQLIQHIPMPQGLLWLTVALAFIGTFVLYIRDDSLWPFFAIGAVIVSQILIAITWEDAKFGTIANLVVLLVATASLAAGAFHSSYISDVTSGQDKIRSQKMGLVSDDDLENLPIPAQRYLRFVGVVGRPKVHNFKAVFEGQMRSRTQSWFTFSSEQHNFLENPARFFFMRAKVKGLPTVGYHRFQEGCATMLIKILSLVPVVDQKGIEMDKSETVTFFNDLCLLAPAGLINPDIQWQPIDDLSCRAIFQNDGISISALLEFNKDGQLINFESDDRFDIRDMKQRKFSTPIYGYSMRNGLNLCNGGDAIWHYSDGPFTYGKFFLKSIEYNVVE